MADGLIQFCAACGSRLEAGAHFCATCGHQVGSAAPAPPPVPYGPAQAGGAMIPPGAGALAPSPVAQPRSGERRWLFVVIGVVGVIALIAVVGVVMVMGSSDASAEEVVLEPLGYQQPDAFTPTVANQPEAAPPSNAVRVPPSGTAEGGQQVAGGQAGLYGGTTNNATCDPEKLIAFLQANPDKGRAWAGVLGVATAEIPTYVRSLSPVILTRDTRVTNHGYANGKSTMIPAVLQAGTAVMVDKLGVPRVKCGCGNPLTEPPPLTNRTQFKGPKWSGFSVTTLVQVTVSVEVKTFVLVDVNTGGLISRPPGAGTPADTPMTLDDLCKVLPADPLCVGRATSPSTTSTAPPPSVTSTTALVTTVPTVTVPTVPPTVPPETQAPDRSAEATDAVLQAITRCSPESMEYVGATSARVSPERDTLYEVNVHIVLDSGDWWALFEADFATEFGPEVRSLNADSAPLICS